MSTAVFASRERSVIGAVNKSLYIGGAWRPASNSRTLPVYDPATNAVLCEVADATPTDGLAALDAAVRVQRDWAAHPPRERGEILRRGYELMMRRQSDLALLMTLEMGKPLAESEAEIAYAAEFFRWFAEEAVRIDGGYSTAPNGTGRLLVMRQPVGPAILITPWNFPAAMGARKIGPAVAAGCSMVLKPAAQTPLSMLALAEILAEAGLPDGVLNVITTSDSSGVIAPIIADGRARKLSFTGSTEVGRVLLKQCADKVLRTSMELGGNAPFLVFEDADLDAAVDGALTAKMRNIGEACTAANRFYVQRPIAEQFAQLFTERMAKLPIGRGTEAGVVVGPLINAAAVDKVQELVVDAKQHGAQVLTGGKAIAGKGHFYPPTVLFDVNASTRMAREEIFGPVAPITIFDTEDEAITAANNTEFGLVSYVYTTDLQRCLRVCERLEAGMIGLNQGTVSNPAAPFGGIKESGLGREGGRTGIDEYLETKYVAVALP
ncbi:MAG: NAD-dependent succinate-semialdehyde dehydrogenase [Acidimicrobiales bacterium]|nr:MAG: NAD-dependent succinate-semialdehyde dehydrogenase [Acidimicrobiales bacterium]